MSTKERNLCPILVLTFLLNGGVVCFSVWQLYLVRSGECSGIHSCRVLFGMEGWLGQMMPCPMKGM